MQYCKIFQRQHRPVQHDGLRAGLDQSRHPIQPGDVLKVHHGLLHFGQGAEEDDGASLDAAIGAANQLDDPCQETGKFDEGALEVLVALDLVVGGLVYGLSLVAVLAAGCEVVGVVGGFVLKRQGFCRRKIRSSRFFLWTLSPEEVENLTSNRRIFELLNKNLVKSDEI